MKATGDAYHPIGKGQPFWGIASAAVKQAHAVAQWDESFSAEERSDEWVGSMARHDSSNKQNSIRVLKTTHYTPTLVREPRTLYMA